MENKVKISSFIKIIISLIIAFMLWHFVNEIVEIQNDIKHNREVDEYNKDVLLKLQMIDIAPSIISESSYDYYYVINRDNTLTISYGKEFFPTLKEFTGLKNANYEKTIKLTDTEISNIESLVEAFFKRELPLIIASGETWQFTIYYDYNTYSVYNYSHYSEKYMYDIIEEILSLAPDDFEGNLMYKNLQNLWALRQTELE